VDTFDEGEQTLVTDAAAQLGGTQLAGFLDGIVVSRTDDPHLTALGHSYGSTTIGYALQQADGLDDAVLFGSPGASTGDITDLRVPPEHVAVLEARQDFVADFGSFGGDPNQLDGVTNLSAREETAPDGTTLNESVGHNDYLAPRTTSQYNIAATVAGLPDLRIIGTNDGVGDIVRTPWNNLINIPRIARETLE
jgi:pimeloyl-ACP methyl ester carboxylesterase